MLINLKREVQSVFLSKSVQNYAVLFEKKKTPKGEKIKKQGINPLLLSKNLLDAGNARRLSAIVWA